MITAIFSCANQIVTRNLGIVICLVISAAMSSGCAPGSGEGLDENGRPIGENGPATPLTAEFGSIQQNVFTPNCAISGCHIGAAAPEGLKLDQMNSFALLVSVPSTELPGLLRVNPNNPDLSYLVRKLEGTATVGGRMPLTGPPFLPQETVDVIRQWITNGALPAQGPPVSPIVVSVEPGDGSGFDDLPNQITVIFSEDMDPTLVNSTTVQLTLSGGDGTFNDGNEIVVNGAAISLSAFNLRLLTISLLGVPNVPEVYQLRLVGTGVTALASLVGLILDGDADGASGGDFTSIFTVNAKTTWSADAAPILASKCALCHTGLGFGGHNVATNYADALKLAVGGACVALTVGQCTIVRIQSGAMPQGRGCSGDPAQDVANASCLTQAQQDTIQDWIDDGLPQ